MGRSDPTRFKRVFMETWNRLHEDVRRVLVESWSDTGCDLYYTFVWKGIDTQLAQCTALGAALKFLKSAAEQMPDDVLACCIAHELAYAFFFAIRDPYHCDSPLHENDRRRLAEALVREMCNIWGFPAQRLASWCVANQEWLERNAAAARTAQ